jgi:DNA-directed RNA polymerase specialized sigma24 family protein
VGSDGSFEAFVDEHGERLVRAARLLTGDWHSAEDLAQESLVRLYACWPGLRDQAAAYAYVHRTMVRLHGRWRARRWTREVPSADLPELGRDDDDMTHDGGLAAALAGRRHGSAPL